MTFRAGTATIRVAAWLPKGTALPDEIWAQRHRAILRLLWLHVPAVVAFAVFRGQPPLHGVVEGSAVAFFGVAAHQLRADRRQATVATALGLLTSSAVLVHLSDGTIEMHFHYFVMVGVITLYQDWWPFLVAIGYVVLQHGLAGLVDPRAVYNHAAAVEHPWRWAGIHGFFILGMSGAGIASWRLNEAFLAGVLERSSQLAEAQSVARLGSWERDLVRDEATWSEELFRLVGLDAEQVVAAPETFLALVHDDDRPAFAAGLAAAVDHGTPFAVDLRVRTPTGERWLHCRARATFAADGTARSLSGTVQDITDRKQADVHLHETLSLLGAALDATADGLLVIGLDGRVTSFNQRFLELWRVPEGLLHQGDELAVLRPVLDQVVKPVVLAAKAHELLHSPEAASRDTVEFQDGRIFERHSMPQRIDGQVVGRVWSFRDVTEQKRLEGELAHQAFHDALTGLANQALFRDRVEHALARSQRAGQAVAVLYLDLDNFKRVNDSLGHTAGDHVLVTVADRLRDVLRATDTAARLGGDEFAVLLEDVKGEAEVEAVAERLIETIGLGFRTGASREVFIGTSLGIAYSTAARTTDELLSEADLAMYTAKRRGKGRWESYRDDLHCALVDRLELEADLRRALVRDELVVHYQPIVSLSTSAITGVEALVRWQHPERGLLPPDTFIPLAEDSGMVIELGRQVLVAACRQVRTWQEQAPHLTVSVNVAPRQLQDDAIVDHVRAALEVSGLPPASLVLEITETAMMQDTDATIAKLGALKALGVKLAIDDFGTGYSSLSYLQRFPVDVLKIDRAFVSTLAGGEVDASLASTIVSLAKSLRLRAVAEGVETASQASALAAYGCELAQGYLFARPAAAAEIGRLLTYGLAVA